MGGAAPTPAARPVAPINLHVILAVFKRNFTSYFSNPAGYVFITLFVFVSACAAFWQPIFFARNLANLDTLNTYMPALLLFFVPAITMSIWADERRQGTDELLFTLPAHDVDIVLGKYLAAVGIYSVALLFSTSHIFVLMSLGRPDPGVMFATYLGYWLMGAMLIAVGMVASLLTTNATVAFILGAVFCAIPIALNLVAPAGRMISALTESGGTPGSGGIATWLLGPLTEDRMQRMIESLSVPSQFHDFGAGVIPVSGLFYFLSLAVAMLFVNMVLLGRRHWAGGQKSTGRSLHALVRIASVLLALASLNVLIGRTGFRVDASEEHLNSLSSESIELIKQIPKDQPVYVQVYYSPEVPRDYVETKSDLLNLLKEYAAWGGDKIRLNLVETELYSPEAHEAEKRFGIEPRQVRTVEEAKQSSAEFYLGVAFTSGLEEVVIPFFDRGLPVEYELTRSIRVVSRTGRKKVGILNTDAKLMGGFDMRSFGQNPEWSIVTELKKQYEVSSVAPDSPIPSDLDVLLVAQPSSLAQRQIDNLTDYVKRGGPTLLFLDPFTVSNPSLSPEVPKQPAGGPFGGGPPPEPKGDLRALLDLIGLEWPTTQIVWNDYNPHPQLADLPPEVVFVGKGSGEPDAFNKKQVASSGLQEIVMMFPGLFRAKSNGSIEYTPLLRSNDSGGTVPWSELAQQGFMGVTGINRNARHVRTGTSYTLAARLQGTPAADADKDKAKGDDKEKKADTPKPAEIKVVAIADLDMISDQFFDLRRNKVENLDFDNVTFVLNSVDVLAGDESFVSLRKRRLQHRTLKTLEDQVKEFDKRRQEETKAAEDAAEDQLKLAQQRLDKQVKEVQERKDLDERTKEIMLANLQDVANRRLDVEKTKIEDEKRKKVQESKGEMERRVRGIQLGIKSFAILFPPLPALILGLIVAIVRSSRENRGATPTRLA